MHEFSLATQIADKVREYTEARQTDRILRVHLQIGELTSIEAGQLRLGVRQNSSIRQPEAESH